jgi:hypothetical protein
MTKAVVWFRAPDGRFSTKAAAGDRCTLDQARALYQLYLAAVCSHQGVTLNQVKRELARPGRPCFDREWRRAAYARQLALYLTNTVENVPQAQLAEVTGLTRAGVGWALRAIEDLRDRKDFDANVDLVAGALAEIGPPE